MDSNLFRLIERKFDNRQIYALFNPEIIGLEFLLQKVCLDYKNSKEDVNKIFYIKKHIVFLLDKVCSLEELISSVPKLDGENILFDLVSEDSILKFISNSKPKNMQFFVDTVRNLLLSVKDLNLEELSMRKVGDSDDESGLSVLLHNLSVAMGESGNSDINYKVIENLLIDDPISKDDIDQLVRALSKIQLLIWQNRVLYPEIVAEKYELAILGINTFLKYAEVMDNINKEIYYYFTSKFIRSVDRKYIKDLKATIQTITYKMVLDTEVDEIPVSLKLLSCFSLAPIEKNLLISNTFVPRDKKITLYDLSGLCFDDNLMIALSEINTYFNIDQCDLNVSYDKNESKSWELLFNCIRSGHLDFNPHIERAESNLISLNIAPTK